jgi:hypothetical protein
LRGWFIVAPALPLDSLSGISLFNSFPPSTLSAWMGGVFLIATKHFARYRLIKDITLAQAAAVVRLS